MDANVRSGESVLKGTMGKAVNTPLSPQGCPDEAHRNMLRGRGLGEEEIEVAMKEREEEWRIGMSECHTIVDP